MNLYLEEKRYPAILDEKFYYKKFEETYAFGHLSDELYSSKKILEVKKI